MMSLHIHHALPKPSSSVSLPPISSLLGRVDSTAFTTTTPPPVHEALLVQQRSGDSLPVMIPHDNRFTSSSVMLLASSSSSSSSSTSLGRYSHAQTHGMAANLSRSSSSTSLQSNSPAAFDTHTAGASILSSLSSMHHTTQYPTMTEGPAPPSPFDGLSPPDQPPKSRKYRCRICEKSFTTSGHLARHARIHTGERKHECPHPGCEARFARQDNCMQHYRTHKKSSLRRKRKL